MVSSPRNHTTASLDSLRVCQQLSVSGGNPKEIYPPLASPSLAWKSRSSCATLFSHISTLADTFLSPFHITSPIPLIFS